MTVGGHTRWVIADSSPDIGQDPEATVALP